MTARNPFQPSAQKGSLLRWACGFGDIFHMVCRRLCVAQVPQSMQVSKGPSAQADVADDEAIVIFMEIFDGCRKASFAQCWIRSPDLSTWDVLRETEAKKSQLVSGATPGNGAPGPIRAHPMVNLRRFRVEPCISQSALCSNNKLPRNSTEH